MSERVPLTRGQYRFIYERAGDQSEWTRNPHEEYNVHHISPVGWCVRRLGETADLYNAPERLILLTVPEHEVIHPDMLLARAMYAHNRKSYRIMFERRRKLTTEGKPYWVATFDNVFERIAKENTEKLMRVKQWPVRKLAG